MTTIDCHMHVNFRGFGIKDIIAYLDVNKIDSCWLLTWEEINPGPWHYQPLPIEKVYEAFLQYPERIVPFYCPDPHRSDAGILLEKWHDQGIRGCGELKSTVNWNSGSMIPILEILRKYKMPVIFHMEESEYRSIPYSQAIFDRIISEGLNAQKNIYKIPQKILQILVNNFTPLKRRSKKYYFPGYMLDFSSLENILQEYPDIHFVAHGPMLWNYISSDVINQDKVFIEQSFNYNNTIGRLLGHYSNLLIDISGPTSFNVLKQNPKSTYNFFSMFGNRILFGSDNYVKDVKRFVDFLKLPKDLYVSICGGNASALLDAP